MKRFKSFMQRNLAWKEYKRAYKKQRSLKLNIWAKKKQNASEHLLTNAFEWSSSKEGFYFWYSLNIKWQDVLKRLK